MTKKSYSMVLVLLALLFSLSLASCNQSASNKAPSASPEDRISASAKDSTSAIPSTAGVPPKTRTITDLTGKAVEIPMAQDIHRVIIVAPPLPPTFASVTKDTSKLVGLHPGSIKNANKNLLDIMIPNWKEINTTFLTGFTSNPEEVLKLNPDIILVYGDFQKKGLENITVPIVDFFLKDPSNENWSVQIDKLMRDIFEVDDSHSLQKEWDEANAIVNKALLSIPQDQRKSAIMIGTNAAGKITVRGAHYYGDDWLIKTGLTNAAGQLEGDGNEVTMEQIYQWNPEIIYDFGGTDASSYLDNTIEGQDWSSVKAFQNRAIYDTPQGMFNWGAPNADSPLTLIWMTMKNYPGSIDPAFFNTYMKDFYKRQYHIDLSDADIESILDPVKGGR